MINKIYEVTDEQFVNLIKNSANISEVLFKLGYSIRGNSWGFSQVRRRMTDLNLDYSNFKGKSTALKQIEHKINPDSLLKENSKHNRNVLRRYLIKNDLIPYKCAICGITEWNNKTLSLELDHINGINNDNRLENLRFLCPNCHSQTSTYGSKNLQKNESKYDITEELRTLVENTYTKYKSIKRVSALLGIRRCVVTKIVNESGQKHLNQKYVIRYDKNHNEVKRYGSLVEAAKDLIEQNYLKTKRVKTATRTLSRNQHTFFADSYWIILDGCGIINNPQLESSLIDSENNNVDEAQAKAA